MNKMIKKALCGALLVAVCAPGAMARDTIYVTVADKKRERIDVEDVKIVSVCGLKQMIARKYRLDEGKFDLFRSGSRLDEDKTLKGAGARSSSEVTVEAVSYSSQCN
ncbi:ubiquitin-like domain-containing protein [Kordiimonas sp.]|uniref:ubiquitin-like domain-containing protein n=1 Tax=Kordiimonas sp. TaxID=1970157 RepID=UPI003A8D0E0A